MWGISLQVDQIFNMLDRDKTGRITAKNVLDLLEYIEFPGASLQASALPSHLIDLVCPCLTLCVGRWRKR